MLAAISITFPPGVAAGADEERYAAWPYPGTWRIKKVKLAAATAVAVDATDALTLTVSTNDGAGGAFTSIGSLTTDSDGAETSLAVDVSEDIAVSGAGLEIVEGSLIKCAKTYAGAGKVLDGCVTVMAEKVPT